VPQCPIVGDANRQTDRWPSRWALAHMSSFERVNTLHLHLAIIQGPLLLPEKTKLEMWANDQRDGRPAEYTWRPLFNAAVWLTPTTRVPRSNAAKTRNPLKLPGVPQTN